MTFNWQPDRYTWRPNGNYMIRFECEACRMFYDSCALANSPADGYRLCDYCREAYEHHKASEAGS